MTEEMSDEEEDDDDDDDVLEYMSVRCQNDYWLHAIYAGSRYHRSTCQMMCQNLFHM